MPKKRNRSELDNVLDSPQGERWLLQCVDQIERIDRQISQREEWIRNRENQIDALWALRKQVYRAFEYENEDALYTIVNNLSNIK